MSTTELSEQQVKLYGQCAVSSCQLPMEANNEGGLDIQVAGGYGDFCDDLFEKPNWFRLCHKHSHKFANWLNNHDVLHPYYGHSHNGSEHGFWFGHISWEQRTWLSYINLFFNAWYKLGLKKAIYYVKRQAKGHIDWSREDINDSTSKVIWSSVIFSFFFLTNAFKGKFNRIKNLYKRKKFTLAKSYYRKHRSLYSEIWENSVSGKLSESERSLIKDLGAAFTSLEEE